MLLKLVRIGEIDLNLYSRDETAVWVQSHNLSFAGYDINYYFLGRMNIVKYVKNDFLQKLGALTFCLGAKIIRLIKGHTYQSIIILMPFHSFLIISILSQKLEMIYELFMFFENLNYSFKERN